MGVSDYLATLLWGQQASAGAAVSAESLGAGSTTLGELRTDTQIPVDTTRYAGLITARLQQFAQAVSTHYKGGSRLAMLPVSTSPVGATENALWALYAASGVQRLRYSSNNVVRELGGTAGAQTVTFSATPTFDPTVSDFLVITLTANITSWTFPAGYDGQEVTIGFVQDGTGSRTLAAPPANVTVAGGALTLTTTINKRDYVTWRYEGSTSKWREKCRALNQ